MTTNEPKNTVRKATVLGENCGACSGFKVELFTGSAFQVVLLTCKMISLDKFSWYKDLSNRKGTKHPPGRSVCDEFEPME